MSEDWLSVSQKEDVTRYVHAGGSRSLPGPALAGLAREILTRGLPFRFYAPGTSMSPFIKDGDVITLAPPQAVSCRTGVVVAFIRPEAERLIVHRVIAVSREGCRIRGDNSSKEDGFVPHTCIIGHVIRVERAGKTIRLGLGPERIILALLSRNGLLPHVIGAAGSVYSVIRRLR